ncbi:Copalyl diphosphate synthase [Melia azedarach]|uniref:Copalyl diphosphate synthase n=1 Tax=Melia azedarach TaxID=155640 RepID=A0ACC1WTW9_MELAZ|nr:Copalyl diphosphate synthase [Melia azedarach]
MSLHSTNLFIRRSPAVSGGTRCHSSSFSDKYPFFLMIRCRAKKVDDLQEEVLEVFSSTSDDEIEKHVRTIKSILSSMDDGEISISPYDTAWVALIKDVNGSGDSPQFPSCLEWISNNQLPDGSWGDKIFLAHDRLLNTLACVVALKSWNIHQDKCEKGISFLKENISTLGNENEEHMTIGFEVAFPSLLELAQSLGIEVLDDFHVLQKIFAMRNEKIKRYWSEEGIYAARNSPFSDIDDTSMGFRLLRLHGYDVSPDVFQQFEEGDEFFCFPGETSQQAVTLTFNLYRATQVSFPGEKILEKARQFSENFLREKLAANKLLDKWVIAKDLPGEVAYALEVPWYASLSRIESRFYIDQYGGEDDVWIVKTLYRMPYINNNDYLELAKLDYNSCQATHQAEWVSMQKWYTECQLENFGTSKRDLLLAYFLASASIYEPERSGERIAWAKTAILVETIAKYFHNNKDSSHQQRKAFVDEFKKYCNNSQQSLNSSKTGQKFTGPLLGNLIYHSFGSQTTQNRDITRHLFHAWEKWLMKWEVEGDSHQGQAELLVKTILNLSVGNWLSEELLYHPQYEQLFHLTNKICYKLARFRMQKGDENGNCSGNFDSTKKLEIESEMQELVQLVLQNSLDGMNSEAKEIFLTVAKRFYYTAHCDPKTVSYHIDKVLFERVE